MAGTPSTNQRAFDPATPSSERVYPDWWNPQPLKPGHTLSLKYGAKSPRVYEPLAQQFIEEAVQAEAYLQQPQYQATLHRWAVAEAKAFLYGRWVSKNENLDDPDFDPQPTGWARSEQHRWQNRALAEAKELGLTPLSRSKLGRNVTQMALNVEAIWNSTPASTRAREEEEQP
ncbi:MAG: hypothetical protein AB1679_12215 [Actinomycetota bacterium]